MGNVVCKRMCTMFYMHNMWSNEKSTKRERGEKVKENCKYIMLFIRFSFFAFLVVANDFVSVLHKITFIPKNGTKMLSTHTNVSMYFVPTNVSLSVYHDVEMFFFRSFFFTRSFFFDFSLLLTEHIACSTMTICMHSLLCSLLKHTEIQLDDFECVCVCICICVFLRSCSFFVFVAGWI